MSCAISFLSTVILGLFFGLVIGLVVCVQIGGIYMVIQFFRDIFKRKKD